MTKPEQKAALEAQLQNARHVLKNLCGQIQTVLSDIEIYERKLEKLKTEVEE